MRLLVLGGTHHVGRAAVDAALRDGHRVTCLNRGISRPAAPGVEQLTADRTNPLALRTVLAEREWDAVIDTWAGAPVHVHSAAQMLAGRVGHYGYVSSRAVYTWPWPRGADESAPLVAADPHSSESGDYASAKRGGELAADLAFDGPVLHARAGMILGAFEDVGRIPWWLDRLNNDGPVLACGPADAPIQYIDAADLTAWMLSAAAHGLSGAFNVAGPPGRYTVGELLGTARDLLDSRAELLWAEPELLEREQLPLGVEFGMRFPGGPAPTGVHDADTTAAMNAGLRVRSLHDTLAATIDWWRTEKPGPPDFSGTIDPQHERRVRNMLLAGPA